MKNKNKTVKLNETQLRNMIAESVKNVLKEYQQDIDTDNYYGGGLPEPKSYLHIYTCEKEVTEIYNQIKPYIDKLADIFNNNDTDDTALYDEIMGALNTLDTLPSIGKQFYSTETPEI